jgi:branched-chain amino acid transport system substrate-binding protein
MAGIMFRRLGATRRTVALAVTGWLAALGAASCSLTNISADSCDSADACRVAFGLGSLCKDGFCTEPIGCGNGHDCRIQFGGGACVAGSCVDVLPPDPNGRCTTYEPAELGEVDLVGDTAPVVVGGIFRLEDTSEPARADAARLAIREINGVGGLDGSRPLAMVVCDNGGPGATLGDEERRVLTQDSIDYLAGTLGVPFIVGPNLSADSLVAVNYVLSQGYPTLLISPSATSPALTNQPDRLNPDDPHGLFWRTCPNDALQGRLLAEQVVGQQPTPDPTITQVAAMFISDAYGEGLADTFQELWGSANTSLHPFDAEADLDALVANVAVAAPDAVLIIAIEAQRTVSILTAMAAEPLLVNLPVYLTDGSKDEQVLLDPNLPAEVQNIIFNQVVGTAPAGPLSAASNVFFANYEMEFGVNPEGNSFIANAYDAIYVGAAGTVHASAGTFNYDGRTVATGLSRLVAGSVVPVGSLDWSNVKNSLTTGERTLDIDGISGPLDFDVNVGEADAPIEAWQPSMDAMACGNQPPCFVQILAVLP